MEWEQVYISHAAQRTLDAIIYEHVMGEAKRQMRANETEWRTLYIQSVILPKYFCARARARIRLHWHQNHFQ